MRCIVCFVGVCGPSEAACSDDDVVQYADIGHQHWAADDDDAHISTPL